MGSLIKSRYCIWIVLKRDNMPLGVSARERESEVTGSCIELKYILRLTYSPQDLSN